MCYIDKDLSKNLNFGSALHSNGSIQTSSSIWRMITRWKNLDKLSKKDSSFAWLSKIWASQDFELHSSQMARQNLMSDSSFKDLEKLCWIALQDRVNTCFIWARNKFKIACKRSSEFLVALADDTSAGSQPIMPHVTL